MLADSAGDRAGDLMKGSMQEVLLELDEVCSIDTHRMCAALQSWLHCDPGQRRSGAAVAASSSIRSTPLPSS